MGRNPRSLEPLRLFLEKVTQKFDRGINSRIWDAAMGRPGEASWENRRTGYEFWIPTYLTHICRHPGKTRSKVQKAWKLRNGASFQEREGQSHGRICQKWQRQMWAMQREGWKGCDANQVQIKILPSELLERNGSLFWFGRKVSFREEITYYNRLLAFNITMSWRKRTKTYWMTFSKHLKRLKNRNHRRKLDWLIRRNVWKFYEISLKFFGRYLKRFAVDSWSTISSSWCEQTEHSCLSAAH